MIDKDSRYAKCLRYRESDGDSLGMRFPIDTSPRFDDRFHTVTDGDRLDLLAHRYLGEAKLWWLICDYNDIFFPLELTPGTVLRIPSMDHVSMHILD